MKRTTKRVVSVILALAMVVSVFASVCVTTASAKAAGYVVTGTPVKGANDREFSIKYELTSNPMGIFSFGRMITFDKNKVEFLGLEHNSSLFPDMYDVDVDAIVKANNEGKFFYTAYSDDAFTNVTGVGIIGSMKFKLREGVSLNETLTFVSQTRAGYDLFVNNGAAVSLDAQWNDPMFTFNDIMYDGEVDLGASTSVVSASDKTFEVDYDITNNTKGIYQIGMDIVFDNTKVELLGCVQQGSVFDEYYEWTQSDINLANQRGKFFYTAWLADIYGQVNSTDGHVTKLIFKQKGQSLDGVVISATERAGYNVRFATPGDEKTATYVNVNAENAYPPQFGGNLVLTAQQSKDRGVLTVDYKTASNPGIAAARVLLQFDMSKIKVQEVVANSAFIKECDITKANQCGKLVVVLAVEGNQDWTANDTLFSVKFTAAPGLKSAPYSISTSYPDGFFTDMAENNIYVSSIANITGTLENNFLPGDIDLNGKVNLLDVRKGVLDVVNDRTMDPVAFVNADVDYNGVVNVKDLYLINVAIAEQDFSILAKK